MSAALVLVLHAHLPWVRHPEHEIFYEENWLYDAITETYIPLIWSLFRSHRSGYRPKLTMSLTPTLLSMLEDPLLINRYRRYLNNRRQLINKEIRRAKSTDSSEEAQLALFYSERYQQIEEFVDKYDGRVVRAFRELAQLGVLEIITCAATHGFLPLMREHGNSVAGQLGMGVKTHHRILGRAPRGIWLPECAYYPELDSLLKQRGLEFFFVDSHGLVNGEPYPHFDVYAPVVTKSGVAAFARDPLSSSQVWSSESGYPGHPRYREFYRDLGWDREFDYIKAHILPDGARVNTGLKYRAVTGKTPKKKFYDPYLARVQAQDHARHFVTSRIDHGLRLQARFGRQPVITAPFDAELFGHWWFEGPLFLEAVFREIAGRRGLIAMTAADIIDSGDALQEVEPSASTWGAGGYHSVWLNPENDKLFHHYQAIHYQLKDLAEKAGQMTELEQRIANQAAREALLALGSDWAFLITKDTAGGFAKRQVATHIRDFQLLIKMLKTQSFDLEKLAEIEERDNIFPDIDLQLFQVT